MLDTPRQKEIDHRTIKLIVGLGALTLASLTNLFSKESLESISASYYEGGLAQTTFIGILFAVSALMMAYNGYDRREMILSKVAATAGFCVALFPCECPPNTPPVRYVHGTAAAVMFLILAYFCVLFARRAREKPYRQAKVRAKLFRLCALAIGAAILTMAYDQFTNHSLSASFARLTFYGEATGLISFGVSWLLASRVLPFLTAKEERFSPLREGNPA